MSKSVRSLYIASIYCTQLDDVIMCVCVCVCVQPVYYETELRRRVMPMTFNLSDKTLRCVANVAHSNFSDVTSSVVIAFNKC